MIEINEHGKVLFLKNEVTKEVGLEERNTSLHARQTWKLGEEQENGWRTIAHYNGLYLTLKLKNSGIGTILKLEDKGKYFNNIHQIFLLVLLLHSIKSFLLISRFENCFKH